MSYISKVIRILAVPLLLFCKTGCVHDERGATLEPYADTDPNPQAIIGLWNGKWTYKSSTNSSTILFRRNGTGLIYHDNPRLKLQKPISFSYEYVGNGIWKTSLPNYNKFRIAKGYLLRFYPTWTQSYDRQSLDSIDSN